MYCPVGHQLLLHARLMLRGEFVANQQVAIAINHYRNNVAR